MSDMDLLKRKLWVVRDQVSPHVHRYALDSIDDVELDKPEGDWLRLGEGSLPGLPLCIVVRLVGRALKPGEGPKLVKAWPEVPTHEELQTVWVLAHSEVAAAFTPEQKWALGVLTGFATWFQEPKS